MLNFIAWYLLITLIGWLTFPLAFRFLPALSDKGYSLARALGLLVWGYVYWLMASLGIIQNNAGGLLLAFIILTAMSAAVMAKSQRRSALLEWIRSSKRMIVMVEVLFFLAFAAWAFVRASNPNIETAGGEKTMELAFINAILRSPTFPPHDPWLSGYAISYYYFGYVMTAMMAKATATLGSVAHNLMSALVFALSFIGAYGILYNLLAIWEKHHPVTRAKTEKPHPWLGLPLLGPLFLLFVSNLEGFLEVLHKAGLFWVWNADGTASSSFWSWIGIKNLVNPPMKPLGLIPNRFIWWWQASRVIQDYDFANNFREVIDEFPAFSYLLGDVHPHVLAMPFGLLTIAVALNLFMGGWKGKANLGIYRLSIEPAGILFGGLLLGGLAFLNTWDILVGFALLAGAYVILRGLEKGWSWERLSDLFAISIPMGILAIVLYLPFYAGFQSQAGGILPNMDSPTRGVQLWIMFAPLFLAIMAYLVFLWRSDRLPGNASRGFGLAAIFILLLWLASLGLAFLALWVKPDFVTGFLNSECSGSIGLCIFLSTMRRLSSIGGILTLFVILGGALTFLVHLKKRKTDDAETSENPGSRLTPFILQLIVLASVLVIAPEFVFLRDLFGNRMNTIFKFYYQAWLLWSLASAFGVAVLLKKLKGIWSWIFRTGLFIILIMALTYPVMALPDKTNNFQSGAFSQELKSARAAGDPHPLETAAGVWTLDGSRLFRTQYPDDAAAAEWLLNAPEGVIAEAFSKSSSYSDYARMSVYSGDPTVLGWWYHEWQWRGSVDQQVSPITDLTCAGSESYDSRRMRSDDISCLYETKNWAVASEVIQTYHIRYIVIGTLERRDYRIDEQLFQQYLVPVFKQGQVVIYEVPE